MKIKIGKRIVGELRDGVFEKHVNRAKHFMRKLNAWGIDAKIFRTHLLPVNARIRIVDEETKTVYECDAATMHTHGSYLHFTGAMDYGTQLFLEESYFTIYPLSQIRRSLESKVEGERIETVNKLL